MRLSLGELATRFGCELIGDPSIVIDRVATLANADAKSLSFFANRIYREQLRSTGAAAVISRPADAEDCPAAVLVAANPYLVYARVATLLHPQPGFAAGTHATAVVSPSARIAKGVYLGPHAVIADGAVIAKNAYIGPNCIVGERCSVGPDTHLIAAVTLVQDVQIGAHGLVHPGVIIGSDGFGHATSDEGWVKVPQLGGVRIGDDVEVGSGTTIDRGAVDDTVIGNGVKLDNQIQIAHNVIVGEHTAMAAMTGIAGSTVIGKRCMFGGNGGATGHLTICDDVAVGACSLLTKNITSPGFYTNSFVAEDDKTWKRQVARFRRLGDLAARVKKLEKASGNK